MPVRASEVSVVVDVTMQLAAGINEAIQGALNRGAAIIADEAVRLIDEEWPPASLPGEPPHRRTGELQDSIQPIPNAGQLEADVVASAPYAVLLEFGTSTMAARPFMSVAAARSFPDVQDQMNGIFDAWIEGKL